MAKLNPQGVATLKRRLSSLAYVGAQAAAEVLREKLSGAGSGIHHAGQPNRSSTPGEYPAEQSGELRDSIAAEPWGELAARWGPIKDPPPYVDDLHFRPPDDGGRPFVDDALQDRDIHQAVRKAVGIQ